MTSKNRKAFRNSFCLLLFLTGLISMGVFEYVIWCPGGMTDVVMNTTRVETPGEGPSAGQVLIFVNFVPMVIGGFFVLLALDMFFNSPEKIKERENKWTQIENVNKECEKQT